MIIFTDVHKAYSSKIKALRGVSFNIDDGEFVFVVGRSGAGKTTLIRLLLKEEDPDSGTVTVNDMLLSKMPRRYIPKYRRTLGVVFQDFRLLEDLNVYDNIAFAQRVIGASSAQIKESVPKALGLVGLSSKYKQMPSQLSGGEKQRVAIARAIINKPSTVIADEPTGNLDAKTAEDIMHIFDRINEAGTTVIMITHDKDIVRKSNRRVIRLDKGLVTEDNNPQYDKDDDPFDEDDNDKEDMIEKDITEHDTDKQIEE